MVMSESTIKASLNLETNGRNGLLSIIVATALLSSAASMGLQP